jgi:hypothetical protein
MINIAGPHSGSQEVGCCYWERVAAPFGTAFSGATSFSRFHSGVGWGRRGSLPGVGGCAVASSTRLIAISLGTALRNYVRMNSLVANLNRCPKNLSALRSSRLSAGWVDEARRAANFEPEPRRIRHNSSPRSQEFDPIWEEGIYTIV